MSDDRSSAQRRCSLCPADSRGVRRNSNSLTGPMRLGGRTLRAGCRRPVHPKTIAPNREIRHGLASAVLGNEGIETSGRLSRHLGPTRTPSAGSDLPAERLDHLLIVSVHQLDEFSPGTLLEQPNPAAPEPRTCDPEPTDTEPSLGVIERHDTRSRCCGARSPARLCGHRTGRCSPG